MRTYSTPMGKLPSITTILGIIAKPYLIPWVRKEAREATIEAVWNHISFLKGGDFTKEKLTEIITESVKEHERIAKKALDIGSLCHNAIECFYKEWDASIEEFIMFTDTYYPQISDMIQTFFEVLKVERISVLEAEKTVWHPSGFAGTLDCIAEIDGSLYVGDYKTSKQLSWEYYLQTEAYRQAENSGREYDRIQNRFILRLDKEKQGKYELKIITDQSKNDDDWHAFQNCFELWKAEKEKTWKEWKPKTEGKEALPLRQQGFCY